MSALHSFAAPLDRARPAPSLAPLAAERARAALENGLAWPGGKSEGPLAAPLEALQSKHWQPAATSAPSEAALERARALLTNAPPSRAQLVFVDGRHAPSLSTDLREAGVQVAPFVGEAPPAFGSLALHEHEAYAALNTALVATGARIEVAPGQVVDGTLSVVYVDTEEGDGALVQPRTLIVAGANASVQVVERHLGSARTARLTNAVTEVVAGDNAQVHLLLEQAASAASYHLGTVGLALARDARCRLTTFDAGSALCRRSVRAELRAPGAEVSMWHVATARARAQAATRATTWHGAPDTRSQQIFRAVADDGGAAAFAGTVHIVADAARANAEQMSRGLLMSPTAKVSLKPQLMIDHDDVKCAHGATVGALDAEALFYLTSRGLSGADATELLTFAFLNDALAGVSAAWRTHLEGRVAAWLGSAALPRASQALEGMD